MFLKFACFKRSRGEKNGAICRENKSKSRENKSKKRCTWGSSYSSSTASCRKMQTDSFICCHVANVSNERCLFDICQNALFHVCSSLSDAKLMFADGWGKHFFIFLCSEGILGTTLSLKGCVLLTAAFIHITASGRVENLRQSKPKRR